MDIFINKSRASRVIYICISFCAEALEALAAALIAFRRCQTGTVCRDAAAEILSFGREPGTRLNMLINLRISIPAEQWLYEKIKHRFVGSCSSWETRTRMSVCVFLSFSSSSTYYFRAEYGGNS